MPRKGYKHRLSGHYIPTGFVLVANEKVVRNVLAIYLFRSINWESDPIQDYCLILILIKDVAKRLKNKRTAEEWIFHALHFLKINFICRFPEGHERLEGQSEDDEWSGLVGAGLLLCEHAVQLFRTLLLYQHCLGWSYASSKKKR